MLNNLYFTHKQNAGHFQIKYFNLTTTSYVIELFHRKKDGTNIIIKMF